MNSIEDLHPFRPSPGKSVLSVFRQLVANGAIKFRFPIISVEPQEHDLQRVHDIINEIDDRRAFYIRMQDERPQHFVDSILDAKTQINTLRRGIWANEWAREMVQRLLHVLGEFLTATQNSPIPPSHDDPQFAEFEDAALDLRLKAWTIVAHLVVVFGTAVEAYHLPDEIRDAVKRHYEKSGK